MKKSLLPLSLLVSLSAYADGPQFSNLSKDDVEDVAREFGSNFTHTVLAAPETDGVWGVEVGVVAGQTASPEFKEVIEKSGGDGQDFKNIYHAGAIARVHFPFDLFAELNILPEQEFSDVTVKNRSFGFGWNAGGFFSWPVDVAIGVGRANSEVTFTQTTPIPARITLETQTTNVWVGASKTFWFFTPYIKLGSSRIEGDLSATGSILGYTASTKEDVVLSGRYLALGANFQFSFLKLGVEHTRTQDTRRLSAKLSLDF